MIKEKYLASEKFNPRIFLSNNSRLKERINSVKKINYNLFLHKEHVFNNKKIFTIILTVYQSDFNFIKSSINSVFSQTYNNTEIIIIDNGTQGEIKKFLESSFEKNPNSKLIQTNRNEFDPFKDDLNDPIINLLNAGLFTSIGDYVYFLSYDDMLSTNYVEKMVQLFESNPNCYTTSPLIQSIDANGNINKSITEIFLKRNNRNKYTNGIELAESYMNEEDKILFPGGLLAIKSELVLNLGGFDNMSDLSQLFKFGVNGDSGFDNDAILFWRHHSLQTNLLQKKLGLVYYQNCISFLENYSIFNLHNNIAGTQFANKFLKWYKQFTFEFSTNSVRDSLKYGLKPFFKALLKLKNENAPYFYFFFIIVNLPFDIANLIFQNILYTKVRYFKRLLFNSSN